MTFLKNVSLILFMLMFASWTSDLFVTCTIEASVYEMDSEFNVRPVSAAKIKYHKESEYINFQTADEDTDENGQATFPVTEEQSATIRYIAEKPQYTSSSETKSIVAGDCTISLTVMNLNELGIFEKKLEQQVNNKQHDLAKANILRMKSVFKNFDTIKEFKNIKQLEMKMEGRKMHHQDLDKNPRKSRYNPLIDDKTLKNPKLQNTANPLINVKPEIFNKVELKEINVLQEVGHGFGN